MTTTTTTTTGPKLRGGETISVEGKTDHVFNTRGNGVSLLRLSEM